MSGGFYTSARQLPGPQFDALFECVRGGGLKRVSRGFASADPESNDVFNTRTVHALARADLVQLVEGEGMVKPTKEGSALIDGDQFA